MYWNSILILRGLSLTNLRNSYLIRKRSRNSNHFLKKVQSRITQILIPSLCFDKGGKFDDLREIDRSVANLLPSKFPTLNIAVRILCACHDMDDLKRTVEKDLSSILRSCASVRLLQSLMADVLMASVRFSLTEA